jgi:hypothetical protein
VQSELRRAYAILELSPPVDERVLRHQYRELTKRWHPDRYATDPIGQSEATQRMRAINDAYRTVAATLKDGVRTDEVRTTIDDGVPGLSRETIDGVVASIEGLNSWSLRPQMSWSRWLSLSALVAYFVIPFIFLGESAANREVARAISRALGYFLLPLFLIWMADAQESRVSQVVFRAIGWLFMIAPAVVGAIVWAWQ